MATKTRESVLQRYTFLGLAVQFDSLTDAEDNADRTRKHKGPERLRPVSQHIIDVTGERHPNCKCEQRGLYAGMSLDALQRLGSGCTPGWVCPRLDSIRRSYGH